jgi:penicillin-binding protein 1C
VASSPPPTWRWHWRRRPRSGRSRRGPALSISRVSWLAKTLTSRSSGRRSSEDLARRQREALVQAGASAVAIVVVSNPRAEILAYVGSHEPTSVKDLGQNDGAASLRQPGSVLKPFLYAAAMDRLGYGPDTILPDEPLTFRTPSGHFTPDNFDRRFRGPVSLSRALSSSLNVPAVFVLERLGVARGLETLRQFGLTSLERGAEHYGLGLALGVGEVSLLELTAAYSALSRAGAYQPLCAVQGGASTPSVAVVSPMAARAVTSILEDPAARSELFAGMRLDQLGRMASFALKTGTSTGFRDAWAFVYDAEWTVGVWVGNFDGRPMVKTSGAVGAAPLAIEVLVEARALVPKPRALSLAVDQAPRPGAVPAAVAWSRAPRITFPAHGARLSVRDLERPRELVVRAADAPSDARLLVDGRAVPWHGKNAVIPAETGRHEARLVDRGGVELFAVTFQVSL